jgi:hypothetical protein
MRRRRPAPIVGRAVATVQTVAVERFVDLGSEPADHLRHAQ